MMASVLNITTGESTRYTNFSFISIIRVADNYYGVKPEGIYLLSGDTDDGTVINGSITTKDSDLGTNESKRVQYVYLGSDTATTITPYFDGIAKQSHRSSFGGRKTKMALGNSGRYIQLKIDGIDRLQSMEVIPTPRQRRIK